MKENSVNEPVLSIIVPVYKVEAYISACIDSILYQTFEDFELILVDDGSPDRCGEICEEYAKKDSRIKVIHKPNGGLSSARNAGIKIATGKYFTFVDSDDTIAADTYTKNIEILLNDLSIDLLEFPANIYYQSLREFILAIEEKHVYGKDNIFSYWMKSQGYRHAYAWNKIYKRELFNQIRFPEGKTFEDIYTIPQLLKLAGHLYMSPYGMYFYYLRSSSITQNASYEDHFYLLDANLNILDNIKDTSEKNESLLVHYLYTVNNYIDLLRCKERDNATCLIMTKRMEKYNLNLFLLLKLDIPMMMKLKNIPLALLGLRVHSLIYTKFLKPL